MPGPEARGLKRAVRRVLGRLVVRLDGMAAEARREQRLAALTLGCRLDPSSVLGPAATIVNCRHDPDDISIGPNCAVMGQLTTFPQGGRIVLGEKVFVGEGTRIWSAASVKIGSYVLISHNVNIYDNNSHSTSWQERRIEIETLLPNLDLQPHGFDLKAAPIVIEDDVWIGFNATIKGGVRIGRGAIVGAGAFVTDDVPPSSVVAGNPARVIRTTAQETRTADAE